MEPAHLRSLPSLIRSFPDAHAAAWQAKDVQLVPVGENADKCIIIRPLTQGASRG